MNAVANSKPSVQYNTDELLDLIKLWVDSPVVNQSRYVSNVSFRV